jgi:hypothetical protein
MRVQLAQQVKDILGQSDVVIITERGDDVARRIGQRVKMGFPEVLARHLPRHWTQRGLSWGGDSGDVAGVYRHGRRPPESVTFHLI